VSDHIEVETYKPDSTSDPAPLRMILTGPRSYLLTEQGTRKTSGTRIEVLLRDAIADGDLTRHVARWCRRVEFPVIIDELGNVSTIESEKPEHFGQEFPNITKDKSKFVIRSFPIDRPPVRGDLFVLAHVVKSSERWDLWIWSQKEYPKEHPQASKPPFVSDSYCFQGIEYQSSDTPHQMATRIDYRGISDIVNLSRQGVRRRSSLDSASQREIEARWQDILSQHLASSAIARSPEGWKYKQRLMDDFPLPLHFWKKLPDSIRFYVSGKARLSDLESIASLEVLRVVMRWPFGANYLLLPGVKRPPYSVLADTDVVTLTNEDLDRLSYEFRNIIFGDRSIKTITHPSQKEIEIYWKRSERETASFVDPGRERPIEVASLPDDSKIGLSLHKTTGKFYAHCVLNSDHAFTKWLLRAKERCAESGSFLDPGRFEVILSLLRDPLSFRGHLIDKLQAFLEKWRTLPNLPTELDPPAIPLTEDMFSFVKYRIPKPPSRKTSRKTGRSAPSKSKKGKSQKVGRSNKSS